MVTRTFRIAPTPSGYLHLGNAFNFLLVEKLATLCRAHILLRIDDIDQLRARTEYIEDIFETINWLQLPVTEGPTGVEVFKRQWSQHTRMELYRGLLQKLMDNHEVFACICSRAQLKAVPGNNGCVQQCAERNLPYFTPGSSLKANVARNETVTVHDAWAGALQVNLGKETGCFTVWRKENLPAYQLCSVADDLHFNVTDVVRGNDLLGSTAAQLWIAGKLHLAPFLNIKFYHHPLVTAGNGEKLSKSAGAYSLKQMRQQGLTAADIREKFEAWLAATGLSARLV